jgi:uncharacterized protein YjbI with pentapeptide repeats
MLKKIATFICLLIGLCSALSFAEAKNEREPIQLALFDPIQIFNNKKSIHGLRLNLIYTKNKDIKGADIGWLLNSASRDVIGFETGLVNIVERNFVGAQLSGLSLVNNNVTGAQLSGVNITENLTHGLAIGFVNITGRLKGLQIGLININKAKAPLYIFPFFNFSSKG